MIKKKLSRTESKSFYLSSILSGIKNDRSITQIAKDLDITKQNMNYYISSLKASGIIKKISYGVWEVLKEVDFEEVKKSLRITPNTPQKFFLSLKPDSVRGHAFQFVLQIPDNLRNWNKREQILQYLKIPFKNLNLFGGGQKIEFKGHKIYLTNKSIVIFAKESFIQETAREAQSQAVDYFIKIIKQLERLLRANFSIFGKYKFRVSKAHYSLVKNALAKQYNDQKEKLYVYNDSGLWFIIDNSFNLHEAETGHPKTAVEDNEKVQNFFNSLKQDPLTTTEIKENFQELRLMIKETSERQIGLAQIIEQVGKNVISITKNNL
ncbi:MAG: hypothetical protein Q7R52_03260 [archaeon]|nr:hypothetical protein [archaeon]